MKFWLKLAALGLAAVLGMTGCATEYGKKVSSTDVSFVVKGKTTRAELISRLGPPTNTIRESTGREQLIWEYLKVNNDVTFATLIPYSFAESQQYETATYTAIVNTKGVVIDYSVASGRSSSSNMH